MIYDAAHTFGVKYKDKGIGLYGDASMGGILDNGVGHRLHQIRFCVQSIETIPAI